jgi:hypothetical protein
MRYAIGAFIGVALLAATQLSGVVVFFHGNTSGVAFGPCSAIVSGDPVGDRVWCAGDWTPADDR